MRAFANLLDRLAFTPARNGKLTLLRDYFREAPDPERGWALAALTGVLGFRSRQTGLHPQGRRSAHGSGAVSSLARLCRRSRRDRGAGLAGEARRQPRAGICPRSSIR